MAIIKDILSIFTLFSAAASLFLVIVTRTVFRKTFRPAPTLAGEYPPISILKPVCGEDPGLEQNLEAFFRQDYPKFEIIFGCERKEDPAIKVVRRLQNKYPDIPSKIEIGETKYGYNPKVNNLIRAFSQAQFELILVSDSDTRPETDHLRRISAELDQKNCRLLVNAIRGIGDRSCGSILENLHLNSLILSGVAFLSIYKRKPAGFGKSMLFRRSDLEAAGGFLSVVNFFAEDFVLSRRICKSVDSCRVSREILSSITSQRSITQFINRHGRWAQTRRRLAGPSYLAEIFANPVFWGFFYAVANLFCWKSLAFLFMVTLYKILLDGYQGVSIAKSKGLIDYLLVPVKDLLTGFLWFYPLITDTVYWRGERLKITTGTELKQAGRRKVLGISLPRISLPRWLKHIPFTYY